MGAISTPRVGRSFRRRRSSLPPPLPPPPPPTKNFIFDSQRPPPPAPFDLKNLNLSDISSSRDIKNILARQPQLGTRGGRRFVETAQGRQVRLENERKLKRALELNQLRSKFRSRGIRGTTTSKQKSARSVTTKTSLLGGK